MNKKIILLIVIVIAAVVGLKFYLSRLGVKNENKTESFYRQRMKDLILEKKDSLLFINNQIEKIAQKEQTFSVLTSAENPSDFKLKKELLQSITDSLPSGVKGIGLLSKDESIVFDKSTYEKSPLLIWEEEVLRSIIEVAKGKENFSTSFSRPDTATVISKINYILNIKYIVIEYKMVDIKPQVIKGNQFEGGLLLKKVDVYPLLSANKSNPIESLFVNGRSSKEINYAAGKMGESEINTSKMDMERDIVDNFKKNLSKKLFK